jgi:hypothetical protein
VVLLGFRHQFASMLRVSANIGQRYVVLPARTRRQGAIFDDGHDEAVVSVTQVQFKTLVLLDPSSVGFFRPHYVVCRWELRLPQAVLVVVYVALLVCLMLCKLFFRTIVLTTVKGFINLKLCACAFC